MNCVTWLDCTYQKLLYSDNHDCAIYHEVNAFWKSVRCSDFRAFVVCQIRLQGMPQCIINFVFTLELKLKYNLTVNMHAF